MAEESTGYDDEPRSPESEAGSISLFLDDSVQEDEEEISSARLTARDRESEMPSAKRFKVILPNELRANF